MSCPVFGPIRNRIDGALVAFKEKGSPSKWMPSLINSQRAGKIINLGTFPRVEGLDFIEARKAPMLSDIEREHSHAVIFVGNGDSHRLHRTIQCGAETANYTAFLGCPRRFTFFQLRRSFHTLIQNAESIR